MINLGDPGGPSNGHLVPQREVIKRFLTLVTRDWETLEVPVELEIRLLKERQCQHRRFGVDDIDAATEWAAKQNEFGWNAHYVVNPVNASHVGAARADAIVASRYVFIDTDTPEALARIEASALTPSIEVTTGTVPHRRVHQHFAIAEGMIEIGDWASLMIAAVRYFNSDPAAKDASRAMRVAGTISWPDKKKQARGYIAELTTVSVTDATYTVADLRNTFGPVAADSVPRTAAFADRPAKAAKNHPRRHDDEHGLVLDALSSMPGEDTYSEWVRIGMALHSDVQGSPEGYRAFVAWSAKSSKFDARDCERKWREWDRKPADRLTAGTIFYIARQNGWQDPRRAKSNGAAIENAADVENAAKPPNPNGNDEADADQCGDGDERGPKQANILIALAEPADLFHTPDGTCFADVAVNGHRETWPIRRKTFRHWLLRRFFETTGGAPNSEAVQSALNVIEAKAHFDGPVRPVHVRIGGLDDKLYLDLGDDAWQAAEIDAKGWRVVGRPPVRFRRAAGMQPLPVPQRNGSITRLRSFLNVASDTDFVLAVSWVLAGLRDRGPYPVLVLSGEQGSAKSTFAAILRALLDPNTAPLRALPREERDLFIAANNGHVLAFDNVSSLPAWISDTLCRLATGGGFAARQLYTDQDEMLFDASRPVILNGIEDMVTRPDLADRQLFLTLEPIPEDKRRPEAALWSEFEADRPSILGSLLDAVAEGLKRLPDTRLPKLPRMADFALWATACEVTPWADGTTFWSAYSGNMAGSVEAVIDADPIADSLRTMMTAQSKWEGTSKQLLSALAGIAGDLINKTKSWPATPEALRGRLRRAATGLRKIGIDIVFPDKHARPRNIKITTTISAGYRPENTGVQPSKLSDLSETKRKSSDDKGLAQPEQPTVSDSRSTASSTVGPTDGTKPLKSNGYDGPDSPDSNKAIRSASDEPTWRGKV